MKFGIVGANLLKFTEIPKILWEQSLLIQSLIKEFHCINFGLFCDADIRLHRLVIGVGADSAIVPLSSCGLSGKIGKGSLVMAGAVLAKTPKGTFGIPGCNVGNYFRRAERKTLRAFENVDLR